MPRLIPVGTRVESKESGWLGVVVAHVRASADDAPAKKTEKVRWEKSGVVGVVRPGRLKPVCKNCGFPDELHIPRGGFCMPGKR